MAREVASRPQDRVWSRARALVFLPLVCVLITGLIVLGPGARLARAELVRTEAVLVSPEADHRAQIAAALAREDVRAALAGYGVSPAEAEARVEALTDAEAAALALEIEALPAGGDAAVTIAIVAVIAFMVLLVSDILGYTDVFPWVDKTPGR